MHLFTYGTLMFPAVWRRIAGQDFASQPATVVGFAAYRVADGVYPVMVRADARDRVEGVLYSGVDAATLKRLDDYESAFYERVPIEALVAGGKTVPCDAYVLPERNRRYASDEPWSAANFERDQLDRYLAALS